MIIKNILRFTGSDGSVVDVKVTAFALIVIIVLSFFAEQCWAFINNAIFAFRTDRFFSAATSSNFKAPFFSFLDPSSMLIFCSAALASNPSAISSILPFLISLTIDLFSCESTIS